MSVVLPLPRSERKKICASPLLRIRRQDSKKMKGVVALGLVVIVSIAVMHVNADSSEKMNKYHKRTGHDLIHSLITERLSR